MAVPWVLCLCHVLPELMSSLGNPSASLSAGGGSTRSRPQNPGHARQKEKSLRALNQKFQFVSGHNVYLDKIDTLCHRALIQVDRNTAL